MTLKTLPVGEYWLKVEGEHGQSERIGQLRLVLADQPRLVFMHIAKAAGSTVNAYLASHYAKGSFLLHLESEKAWRSDPASLQKYDLLSGHVGLHSLQRRLGLSQYRLVTVVREPYAQLYSHLAWIRRLSDPGEELRLSRHPDYIKTFSRKLADCDFSHPADLRRLIASLDDAERQLVDNCQVRYFARVEAGARVDAGSLATALAGVRQFDRIGLAEQLDRFLAELAAELGWPAPTLVARENVTSSFYGLQDAGIRVRTALKPLVRYDIQLYDFIRRRQDP